MAISIRSIETAVPPTILTQQSMRDRLAAQPNTSRLASRLIAAAFDSSAIATRHTVLDELGEVSPDSTTAAPFLVESDSSVIANPTTGVRNAIYADHAPELLLTAARCAIDAAGGIEPDDVTHVITVSCTGFYAPGPDYDVVQALGLRPGVMRLHIGFMGCYAAFPALRTARQFCEADPGAVVLIVCIELCSLHLAVSNDPDTIVASSVFADGAASAIVTARPALPGQIVLDLDACHTALTPTGEKDMAWTIGDHGFEMVLSRYVPSITSEHILGALAPLFSTASVSAADAARALPLWAVHPGGRSILDKVQGALALSDDQMEPSRVILRDFGNMSSATILFVLRHLIHTQGVAAPGADGQRVCAMAFGPGLTVESALLTVRHTRG
jgi:predicted naringenin-chalcone synthase